MSDDAGTTGPAMTVGSTWTAGPTGQPVLLVEDSSDDALLIQRAFRKAALAAPTRVEDGEAALAYLAGEGRYADRAAHPIPALVLLDLKLPRKSGLEVLEWLRAQSTLRRLPVVMLTSSRETGDIARAYDLGANSYLVKPVAYEDLARMIAALDLYWLRLNERPIIHGWTQ